jgi:uncharacterized protein with GYD domain
MPTFVALIDWTEQGVKTFQETVDRYEASRARFEQMGVQLTQIYWTLGEHDIVAIARRRRGDDGGGDSGTGLARQPAHDYDARVQP